MLPIDALDIKIMNFNTKITIETLRINKNACKKLKQKKGISRLTLM